MPRFYMLLMFNRYSGFTLYFFFLFPNVDPQYVGFGKYEFGQIQAKLKAHFKINEIKNKPTLI